MDKCSRCGTDTQLNENGNPMCVICSKAIDDARKQTARDRMEQRRSPFDLALGAHI